jgi:3-deoxy-D-manno-octulosonic-acid transferase
LSDHGERLVWIAASTRLGEDEQLLEAFSRVRQLDSPAARRLLLVLVPRHPERFERVGQLCENRGFRLARRSSGKPVDADVNVLLGDTMGELQLLFGASDFAFMGGSLVPVGGHNFIEPAAWGLPLLSGPHLFNFSEVSRLLVDAGGLQVVETLEELTDQLELLVTDAGQRQARGAAALAVADANRGALEKTLALVRQYL